MKKQCSKCKQQKAYSEFHKAKDTSDGVQTMCKSCGSDYHKKRNKDKNKFQFA